MRSTSRVAQSPPAACRADGGFILPALDGPFARRRRRRSDFGYSPPRASASRSPGPIARRPCDGSRMAGSETRRARLCYEGLAWVTGAAIMAHGSLPDWRIFAIAALYSAGAHGIMTLNDFKSVEGDREMGIGSLPVATRRSQSRASGLHIHGGAADRGRRAAVVLGTAASCMPGGPGAAAAQFSLMAAAAAEPRALRRLGTMAPAPHFMFSACWSAPLPFGRMLGGAGMSQRARSAGRHCAARPGAGLRSARIVVLTHIDHEPGDGRRIGAARACCPARWWRCIMRCKCCGRARLRRRHGRQTHAVDRRRHGAAGAGGVWRRARDRLMGDQPFRPASRLAVAAFRSSAWASEPPAPQSLRCSPSGSMPARRAGGGHHSLDHDDRRIRRSRRRSAATARSLFARPRLVAGHRRGRRAGARHYRRRLAHGRRRRPRPAPVGGHREAPASGVRLRRSAPSGRRAISPFSSSSRCSPTAPRN